MSDDNIFSKKGERKISTFIGQELLYDYITDQLDPERRKAIEEFLETNREVQGDITKINNGLAYVEKMSGAVVSQPLIEQIKQPSSYLEVVLMKIRFDQWPQGLRLGLEALLVAVGIACVALVIPWHKVMNLKIGGTDVILTEVSTNERPQDNPEISAKENAEFDDEVPGQEATVAKTEPVNAEVPKEATPAPTPTPVAVTKPTTPPPTPTKTAATAVVATETAADAKRQGFLYRGSISVTNVSTVSQKLVERLTELGGRKAGDVELGWRRGDGSYFHFTLPESRYEEVVAAFGEYGLLKINKEKHERVMPEGIIRLIINVDEKKPGS